ncbi:MAG: hypothetical protein NTX26_01895 [Candidatus Parcubacteria bacterium]|nr:hypothetical protein [Candidatus Parcubacteria bacterium]
MKKYSVYLMIVLGFIIVAVLGLFLLRFLSGPEDLWICQEGNWVKHGNPNGPKPWIACTTKPNQIISFEEIGNLTQDTVSRAWTFVYGEPGAPALKVKLLITQECSMTDTDIICGNYTFKIGDRVSVMGILNGNNLESFILSPSND